MKRKLRALLLVAVILAVMGAACPVVGISATPGGPFLKGRVVDLDGKPIPRARVSVFLLESATSGRLAKTVYADKQGHFSYMPSFSVPGSELWAYPAVVFRAVADRYSYNLGRVRAPDRETVITLWPEYKLTGRVIDEAGKPVPGAAVVLTVYYGGADDLIEIAESASSAEPIRAVTGKDGYYTIRHLVHPEDVGYLSASLEITAKGRARIEKGFYSPDAAALSAPITLPLEGVIEGTVRLPDGGFAPEGTRLAAYLPPSTGRAAFHATVGKDGRYRFTSLPPRQVQVSLAEDVNEYGFLKARNAQPKPWVLPAAKRVTLSDGAHRTLDLQLITGVLLEGKVVDKSTGKPYAGARVRVSSAGAAIGYDYLLTDSEGRFVDRVAPGHISIGADEYRNSGASLDIAEGETTREVTIQVDSTSEEAIIAQASRKRVPPGFRMLSGEYDLTWDPTLNCPMEQTIASWIPDTSGTAIKGTDQIKPALGFWGCFKLDGNDNDGKLAVGIGKSKADARDFDLVYIDRNRNFDLSDDEPVKLNEWVAVQAHQGPKDGDRTANPMMVRVQTMGVVGIDIFTPGAFVRKVTLQCKGGWKGRIKSSAGVVECALVDSDLDGIYDDDLFVDDNGFGKAVPTRRSDRYNFQMVRLDQPLTFWLSKFYSIKTNGIGSKLIIEPYAGPAGTVSVSEVKVNGIRGKVLYARARAENRYTPIETLGKPIELPAGKCRLLATVSVFSNGRRCPDLALETPIVVNGGADTKVRLVGSLTSSISPDVEELVWEAAGAGQFDWVVKLGGSTEVKSIGHLGRPLEPTAKLFDLTGKLVHSTSRFTYPYNGDPDLHIGMPYGLLVPELSPGKYTLQVTLDTKSGLGVLSSKRSVTITRQAFGGRSSNK